MRKKIILISIIISVPISAFIYILFANFDTNDVIVAVLDTGVDKEHELLKGKVLPGIDVVEFDRDPNDEFGHGTHVSGMIINHAPHTKILPIRTLNEQGINGYFPNGFVILYAIMKGADIINMSYSSKTDVTTTLAVKIGHAKGVIFVGAAGDEKANGLTFPANLDEVISVGTTKPSMKKIYDRSNFGKEIDYLAPGVAIESADIQKPYFKRTGTSMSCAYVSGTIAYIKTHNNRVTSKTIKSILDQDAKPIFDQYTYSVIDFNKIKATYENTAYFALKELSLDYKNAEFTVPYEAYFINEIKLFNNHQLVKTINPLEEKSLTLPLNNGNNLIRVVARSDQDFFIEEVIIYKNEKLRLLEDRTAK